MLTWSSITKSYGDRAVLRGIDLSVHAGQVLGLVGSNGAGKTTLISIANGLRLPDSGTVTVTDAAGRSWDAVAQHSRVAPLLGLAPQALGLYPMLTVEQNLRFFGELAGLRQREARTRAREVAALVGLESRLASPAGELSGGQARRLHTAMALVHRPSILFCDEPTVGADVEARRGILDVVTGLAADGVAVVYTTHYLTELEELGADIALLDDGRIVVEAPVAHVLADYAVPDVAVTLEWPGGPSAGDALGLSAGTIADGRSLALAADLGLTGWMVTADGSVTTLRPGAELLSGRAVDTTALVADAVRCIPAGARLRSIDVTPPSLEQAYLAITGRRLAVESEEFVDVVAA